MSFRILFISICLTICVSACSIAPSFTGASRVRIERLYFGRGIGDSSVVSDSSWKLFLKEVVTPNLPNGFSAWRAEGEWTGSNGIVEHEDSFIIEAISPIERNETDGAIRRIIDEYKRRFRQEAVLRVTTSGEASF